MTKKFTLLLFTSLLFAAEVFSQDTSIVSQQPERVDKTLEVLSRIKVSGYLQAQFQYADSSGQRAFAGGDFSEGTDKRFIVRRGRIKFTFQDRKNERDISTSKYVLQFDVSDRGLTVKDAYVNLTDPWKAMVEIKAGIFNRPFGFEIGNSSSLRESPERGRMSQILFPNERDIGASIVLTGPKSMSLEWLKLEAGYFNGTGSPMPNASAPEFDKKKDFIGRLHAKRNAGERIQYGAGVSYYHGGFRSDNDTILEADRGGFKVISESGNGGRQYTQRIYTGVDAQFSIKWAAGTTTLRGEYIRGQQPGDSLTTQSPHSVFRNAVHNRDFDGGYFYFVQSIGNSPWQVVAKYDWYDPNTDVKGDQLGKSIPGLRQTSIADVRYDTRGLGLLYRWDENIRLTAYYDMVQNEKSKNLIGLEKDLRDNLFTVRIQVKF